jgi:hypothetical protein
MIVLMNFGSICRCVGMVRQPEKKCVISAYCSFLINALLPFQCIIKELERYSITAPELYPEGKIEEIKNSEPKKRRHVCWGRTGADVKTS